MSEQYTTVRFQPGQTSTMLCPMCGYEHVFIYATRSIGDVDKGKLQLYGECEDDCEFVIEMDFLPASTEISVVHGTTWNDRVAAKGNK